MQRLISLFKELEGDGYPAGLSGEPERPPSPAELPREPLYFVELLKHLREQKALIDAEKAMAANADQN